MKEKHLTEYESERVKYAFLNKPEVTALDDALQIPYIVRDGRNTLATLPFIGQKRANELWAHFGGNLATILCWLTYENSFIELPDGNKIRVGPKIIQAVRDWFGLDEVMHLSIEVLPEHRLADEAVSLGGEIKEEHEINTTK
jgi:hypothetical protein